MNYLRLILVGACLTGFASLQGAQAGDQLPLSRFLGSYTVVGCTSSSGKVPVYLKSGATIVVSQDADGDAVMSQPFEPYSYLPTFVQVNGPKHVRKWMGSDPVGSPCGRDTDWSKTTDHALTGESKRELTFHFAAICGLFYKTDSDSYYALTLSDDGVTMKFTTGDKADHASEPGLECELK